MCVGVHQDPSGKHSRHWRCSGRIDFDLRVDFGRPFNPVVTLADACESGLRWAPHYVVAQIIGGISGAIVADLMFGLPVVSVSQHARSGPAQWFSEFVATFGLVSVIWGCSRLRKLWLF